MLGTVSEASVSVNSVNHCNSQALEASTVARHKVCDGRAARKNPSHAEQVSRSPHLFSECGLQTLTPSVTSRVLLSQASPEG